MESMEKIYNQYANLIKRYIFCIIHDQNLAEDIMQETFVVAINQIDKFRGDCDIYVWLCSIAKKILYKNTKNDAYKDIVSIDDIEIVDTKLIESDYLANDTKLKLFEALQKLDSTTREVMYLRLSGDLTFKEIGIILHKSENWARVTFFRGKQKLNREDFI